MGDDKLKVVAANRFTSMMRRFSTAGVDYNFQYNYALNNALRYIKYPSGGEVEYAFDSGGRITRVAEGLLSSSTSFATGAQYTSHGVLKAVTLGNGLAETHTFNSRLQQTRASRQPAGTLELRLRFSLGLTELNEAIAGLLKKLNRRPYRKREGCRAGLCAELDRPALQPLPAARCEYAQWKTVRANIDYHVDVERHLYSVQYQLTG